MQARCCRFALCVALSIMTAMGAICQDAPPRTQASPPAGPMNPKSSALIVTVYNEKRGLLDRQALVKLSHQTNRNTLWQTTSQENSQAGFMTLEDGTYDIEVSAVGYITEHKELKVISVFDHYSVDVLVKPDPTTVELSTTKTANVPAKARKQTARAITALRSGRLTEAQQRLEDAYKAAPQSPEVNFLLGYLFFQKRDLDKAQSYLSAAASLDPRAVQALTLLGRLRIERGEFAAASGTLQQAVAADPNYWMSHYLLAHAYLKQRDYENALQQGQIAVEKGRGRASVAKVVLGEALAGLGRKQEAIQQLNSFLHDSPQSPTAQQVREVIADVERSGAESGAGRKSTADTLLAATEAGISMKAWAPPGIDESKPPVAAGVSCPLEKVIQNTGETLKEVLNDLGRFDAVEEVLHEDLDELGAPITRESRHFNYTVAIDHKVLGFDEYRSGRSEIADFPGQIATRGIPALVLVLHPDLRDDFHLTCEGLGQWRGQATWLVHFRQREDRPGRIQVYMIGNNVYSINLKGRAWISANTYQIVRIEAEMMSPMPQIQLLSEYQAVEYAPVLFQTKNVELWLPKTAELYFHFRRHRYLRRHSFDHFMLFSVDTEEKRKVPKG